MNMARKKEKRVYLTPMGKIVAMGEISLRMRETGKTAQQVMDDNEREIQKKMENDDHERK
jgi:hypothetical protein